VVVLTRNRAQGLFFVLEAVSGWSDVGAIIVVDNDSTDGTTTLVQTRFPETVLVRSEENLGATGGRNLGIERARDLGFDFVFLAEDDTTPNREGLEGGLAVLDECPDVGIVGTRGGVFEWGRVRWACYRTGVDQTGLDICDFVMLDGCVARITALDEVGLLRSDYFIMFEEQELGLRLADAGWRLGRIDVDVERDHLGAASSGGAFPWRAYYQTRNHLALCRDRRSAALWFGFVSRIGHQVLREAFDRKWAALAFRRQGVSDALGGRMGARVLPPG
jgi:GT2 family glycosyltransferase